MQFDEFGDKYTYVKPLLKFMPQTYPLHVKVSSGPHYLCGCVIGTLNIYSFSKYMNREYNIVNYKLGATQ